MGTIVYKISKKEAVEDLQDALTSSDGKKVFKSGKLYNFKKMTKKQLEKFYSSDITLRVSIESARIVTFNKIKVEII